MHPLSRARRFARSSRRCVQGGDRRRQWAASLLRRSAHQASLRAEQGMAGHGTTYCWALDGRASAHGRTQREHRIHRRAPKPAERRASAATQYNLSHSHYNMLQPAERRVSGHRLVRPAYSAHYWPMVRTIGADSTDRIGTVTHEFAHPAGHHSVRELLAAAALDFVLRAVLAVLRRRQVAVICAL